MSRREPVEGEQSIIVTPEQSAVVEALKTVMPVLRPDYPDEGGVFLWEDFARVAIEAIDAYRSAVETRARLFDQHLVAKLSKIRECAERYRCTTSAREDDHLRAELACEILEILDNVDGIHA